MTQPNTTTETTPPAGSTEPPAPTPPEPKPETGKTPEQLLEEVNKWKALSRQNEDRAKENADAAKKWQEAEDAKKPEIERLTGQVQTFSEEVAKLRRENAILASGLDVELVEFVTATDAEGIKAQVEKLKGKLAPATPAPPAPTYPQGYQGPPGGQQTGSLESGAELYNARKKK